MNIFQEIFSRLNSEGIRYVVVGGLAVVMHGYPRYTADVDLLVALDEDNIQKMDTLMLSMKFYPRIPVNFKDMKNKEIIKKLVDEKGMKAYTFIAHDERMAQIDVLVEESLDFDRYDATKVMLNDGVQPVPVVSLPLLYAMKEKAGRHQDLADIQVLKRMKEL